MFSIMNGTGHFQCQEHKYSDRKNLIWDAKEQATQNFSFAMMPPKVPCLVFPHDSRGFLKN